jgi:hypothetical protein
MKISFAQAYRDSIPLPMTGDRPSRWKSPWTWIGLSCAVWVLAGILVVGGVFLYLGMKARGYQEIRGRVREEPLLVTAEMIARKDRNLKLVSRDPASHTVTLRNQRTGERFVLGQVGKDRLRIRTDAGEVVPDFTGPGGLLPGRGEEGWLRLGSAAGAPPPWVPVPPGAATKPLYSLRAGAVSGCFSLTPKGTVESSLEFYREELGRRGFEVLPAVGSVSANSPDSTSSLFLATHGSGLLVTWSELPRGNR